MLRRLALHLIVLSGMMLFVPLTTGGLGVLLAIPVVGDYLLRIYPLATKKEVQRLESVIVEFYTAKRDREAYLESLSVWSYEI